MHRSGPRTVPFVLPFVFGGPPQTHLDQEHVHTAHAGHGEHGGPVAA